MLLTLDPHGRFVAKRQLGQGSFSKFFAGPYGPVVVFSH